MQLPVLSQIQLSGGSLQYISAAWTVEPLLSGNLSVWSDLILSFKIILKCPKSDLIEVRLSSAYNQIEENVGLLSCQITEDPLWW
jgi:hypothetical protein